MFVDAVIEVCESSRSVIVLVSYKRLKEHPLGFNVGDPIYEDEEGEENGYSSSEYSLDEGEILEYSYV